MRQRDGLRLLHMRVSGHDGQGVLLRGVKQCAHQAFQLLNRFLRRILDIHPAVERHLIVAASAGVQALARLADALDEQGFHVHVDVLRVQRKFHLARLNVGQDILQALYDSVGILLLNDALLAQHRGVGDRSLDVLPVEPLVKGDRRVEIVHHFIGRLFKASAPKLHDRSSAKSHGQD